MVCRKNFVRKFNEAAKNTKPELEIKIPPTIFIELKDTRFFEEQGTFPVELNK